MSNYQTTAQPKTTASGIPIFCSHDVIISVDSLKPNPRNPNQHPQEQIKLLAEIIKAQGWRCPITVSTRSGLIVRGHGRLESALLLKVEEVPVDYQNYASDEEEWADLIADNRIAEFSEFDSKLLTDLLTEVNNSEIPFMLTGYTDEEYSDILAGFAEENIMMDISDEIVPEVPNAPISQIKDVWYIGNHILICGDSTKRETYETLLGEDKVQLVVACEHLRRSARVIEMDPRFCDVIVRRYYEVTGNTDIRCVRDGKQLPIDIINEMLGADDIKEG